MKQFVILGLTTVAMLATSIAEGAVRRIRNTYHDNPGQHQHNRASATQLASRDFNSELRQQQTLGDPGYVDSGIVIDELPGYRNERFEYDNEPFTTERDLVVDRSPINKRSTYPNYGFPSKMLPTGNRHVIFNPRYLAWAAYDEEGSLVKTGDASGGANWCADIGSRCRTPAGTYKVQRKMTRHYRSKTFPRRASGNHGGAPMAYAMFFHRGYALHHSDSLPQRNASHGCVRVSFEASRWLNQEFVKVGTDVTVRPYENPGYDPTEFAWND